MIDDRYDRSADMRLLELQREALGVPRRVIGTTSYTDPDPIADLTKDDDEGFVPSGTILIASIDAQPRSALIAGALVTVALSVVNDGDTDAADVRMTMALPPDTAYRPGTAVLDGSAASDEFALSLFGSGAEIGAVAAGARRSLVLKISIEAGATDIHLSPHLRAAGGAVLGFRALRLVRARGGRADLTAARPFYESDDEENAAEPMPPRVARALTVVQPREVPPAPEPPAPPVPPAAAVSVPAPTAAIVPNPPLAKTAEPTIAAALPPTSAPVEPPAAPAPVVKAPAAKAPAAKAPAAKTPPAAKLKPSKRAAGMAAAAETVAVPTLAEVVADLPQSTAETKRKPPLKPRAKTKPKAPDAQPAPPPAAALAAPVPKVETVRSADAPVSVDGRGGPILSVSLDRKRYATLSRLFSGPSLGMIAHYLLLNALAAKDALPGDGGDDKIAVFVANQEQLLSRALVSTRLGKTPTPESVGAELPPFPPALAPRTMPVQIPEPAAGSITLVRALSPTDVDYLERAVTNDKAAPFLRTAQLFVGLCANDAVTGSAIARREAHVALTAYAAFATAEIGRIFLRAKLSRAPSLFKETDEAFDEAARTVLATLGRAIA